MGRRLKDRSRSFAVFPCMKFCRIICEILNRGNNVYRY